MMKVMLRMPNAKWRGKGILEAQAPTEPHKSPWASTWAIECSIQNPTNVVTTTHPFIQLHALDTDHTLSRYLDKGPAEDPKATLPNFNQQLPELESQAPLILTSTPEKSWTHHVSIWIKCKETGHHCTSLGQAP